MAVKYSQALCKALLDKQLVKIVEATATANEDISLVDGGAGEDTIIGGSSVNFLTAGFKKGDAIYVRKATASADNITAVQCTAVTATTINLPTGTWTTGEANSAALLVMAADGGSYKNLFNNMNVTIFSGTQPDDPDEASTQKGAATALITYSGFAFGDATYNTTDEQGEVDILSAISANAANTGTGAWFRIWMGIPGTDESAGRDAASTTAIRVDGSVGITTGDLRLVSTAFTSGQPQTLNSAKQIVKMLGVSV